MAITNKNDLSHIVRTTQQWTTSYDSYECIPEGVLCVEFTPDGHVKAKIGNGHDIFSKLPYIGGADLTNYYTKSETAKCVEEIIKANRFIRIKGILQNKDQLPSNADCGDLYFVISQNQSSSNKYDEYVYSPGNTWENLGSIPIDIDLSEYAKIVYVDEKIDEVNERIDDIEQHGTHTHANKDILDLITAAFTAEEKDKLSTLYNYDDTELRELITQASHTHSNKDILDAITSPFTKEDRTKLDSLTPYDDSILKEKITALERLAHEHSNKTILDRTTASFTTEYERKMRWIRIYTGCTGMEEGIAGLVPAAQAGEEDYVLSGSGEWVPQTGGGGTYTLPIASASTLGGIKVGDGLDIDEDGVLSVIGGGGGDSIAEGDGITITTDPQTGVKTISVNTGDGLGVNQDGELEINIGRALSVNDNGELDVDIATANSLGVVKAGSGLNIDEFGNLSSQATLFRPGRALSLDDESVRLPSAYYKAKYVQSDGQARCATNFYPGNYPNAKYVGSASIIGDTDGYKYIFGTQGDNYYGYWSLILSTSNDNQSIITGLTYNHNNDKVNNPITTAFAKGDVINFEASITSGLKLNNELVQSLSTTFAYSTYNMFIFGEQAGYVTKARIYSFKIYNSDDTLLANFVPAVRKSDNEVGFYETVSNQFINSNYYGPPFTTDMEDLDVDEPDWVLNADIATANSLGVVKPGTGLTVDPDGTLNATAYTLPAATSDTLGGIKVGDGLSITADGILSTTGGGGSGGGPEYAEGDAIEIDTQTLSFNVDAIRWDISDIKNTSQQGGAYTQVRSVEFCDSSNVAHTLDSGSAIWDDGDVVAYASVSETIDELVADTGKMCAIWRYPYHIMKLTFVLDTVTPLSDIVKFRMKTANDTVNRDPKAWKIYVRNATTQEWHLVHETSDALITDTRDTWSNYYTFTSVTETSINVKYGNGLTLNASNELEVDLPVATTSTLGGVIIGDGLSIDSDGYISSKIYEAGQGITFDEAAPEGQFKVRNLEYYFDNQVSCQINGDYGPRTYTRVSRDEQCLAAIWPRPNSGTWTAPMWVGLTPASVKFTQSYDSTVLGPSGSFEYKGYTWYYTWEYDLTNSSGVDLMGNLQTMIYTDSTDRVDAAKHLIDLADLVMYEESIDVWGDGTGWLNGAYNDSQSDQFWTNWYYTYHSKQDEYFEVPTGAIKMRLIGISNENDSRLQGGGVDCFNSSHHHFTTVGCMTDEWADIPEGTVYLQFGVKWNELNDRTISSSDIKSVTIDFYYDTPRNDVINAKLGNGLEFDSNDAIQVKLGTGLGFDANGAVEVTGGGGDSIAEGDGIEITTDSQTGVKTIAVNVGAGLEIDPNTGALGVAPGVSSNYSAGEAIEFETVSDTHDIVWNMLQMSNDWVNKAYTAHIGGSFTNDSLCVHSNITPITNLFSIPQTSAIYTLEARDQNDNLLYCLVDYHDAAGNHLNWNGEFISDPTKQYTSLSSAIYISIGVTNTDLSTPLAVSDVKSITLTWKNVTETSTEISVKYGTGLAVDPITNELFVDGQLPEGTIIKKLTYTGTGTDTNNIQFDKKPLAILSLNGSSGQNYGSLIPTFIDSPYLHGVYGGPSNSGTTFRSPMSYDDSTNVLSITNTSDEGLAFNIVNKPYVMYYLTKGHTGSGTSVNNEVSVVKTFSYTGTGTTVNNIQFPETPDMVLSISGPLANGDIECMPIEINHPTTYADFMSLYTQHNGSSHTKAVTYGTFSFNDSTNVLTLTGGDYGDALNYSGGTYYVRYVVNETIPSAMPYEAGEAISIETIGGLQPTNYSNNDFVDSIASMNGGTIVKAVDNSYFTLTATTDDCYTRGVSGQANGSYPFNVKASTKYRFAWDSADPTVHGKVYTYENGLYDAMMHEIDQYDSSYLEFTTSANTTFIQARFGVMYTGDSITYSNVRLYEVIETEDQYNEISVKHGDGLTVNARNELEVNYGNGLEIISNSQYRPEYYFNTQVQCQVHTDNYYQLPRSFTRTYQKTTTDPALCCIWEVYDNSAYWTGPLLVGTTATSVQYTTADTQQTVTYQNTFQYLGQTWYTSGYPDFLNAADHEDKLGYLQYLGSYASVADQIQAAKDLIDLALINAGSLQAKLGSGLSFDANGAIQVTGGGGSGRGITSITKTSTSGLVDTYTILYTDETTSTFEVTNGEDGEDGQDGAQGPQGPQGETGATGAQGPAGQDGDDGNGISSITKTSTTGLVDTYTITYTDGNTDTFTVTNGQDGATGPQGPQGIQGIQGPPGNDGADGQDGVDGQDGADGNGILSVTKTSTSGLVDTYTITYTNGDTDTFTVTNGADGQDGQDGATGPQGPQGPAGQDGSDGSDGADGNGIATITKTSTSGLVDTYTITFTDGTTTTFTITNGQDGATGAQGPQGPAGQDGNDGADGKGIVSVTKTGTSGLVDTYTITFTDSTTTTFTVTNGADGQDGQDGQDGDTGPQGPQGPAGADGADGSDGRGITSITKTSTSGLVDTYTILYTDGTSTTFTVTNGQNGSSATITQGDGISITTDQQTGNKVIAVNPGTGLQVNQTTNELEVSSGVVTSISPTQNTPGSITVTAGDGTTTPVSVINQMGGATSSTAGTAGYVPAPAAGDNDAYLRGDGTWDDSVVTEDDELTLVFVPDDYQPS